MTLQVFLSPALLRIGDFFLQRVDERLQMFRVRLEVIGVWIEVALQRLLRIDHPIRKKQLMRGGTRNHAAPARRAAEAGHDAEARAGMREPRARRGEAEVEREDEIERAAEAVAVDLRDREKRRALDGLERFLPEACELVRIARREALHLGHVRAGREDVRAPGTENQRLRSPAVTQLRGGEQVAELVQWRGRQQVHAAVIEEQFVFGRQRESGHELSRATAEPRDRATYPPTALRIASTAAVVGVPGRKISRMPIAFSFGMSCSGMIPPAKTMMSCAPSSFSMRMISGKRTLCAPDRIESPIASTSSCTAAATICSGVCRSPV